MWLMPFCVGTKSQIVCYASPVFTPLPRPSHDPVLPRLSVDFDCLYKNGPPLNVTNIGVMQAISPGNDL